MDEILSVFHHIHHLGINYKSEHHKVHHCGGKHEGVDYTIQHCKCGKHAINKQEAAGHNFFDNEIMYIFDESCPEIGNGHWHVESGTQLLGVGALEKGDIFEFSFKHMEDFSCNDIIPFERSKENLIGLYVKSRSCPIYNCLNVDIRVKGWRSTSRFVLPHISKYNIETKRVSNVPVRVRLVGKVQDLLDNFEIEAK
jgi:hypothetical protein